MNAQQGDQNGTMEPKDSGLAASDLFKTRTPIGNFAGSQDFLIRVRNGKLVAADTGDQGGGQN